MSIWDSRQRQAFRRRLRAWYAENGRHLPWRESRNAYRVWISEIMLQQTTVAAVVPYFERFMRRFPTVKELASASLDDVLRLWEGLGYYSRARNIHKAAILLAEQDGCFPEEPDELEKLPGIGRYTAAAIASFAFGKSAGIVEANTLRLYCRLIGYRGNPRSKEALTRLWAFADEIVPRHNVGAFNQALMDLGATLCRPRDPDCPVCPVRQHCAAFEEGSQDAIPAPKSRPAITYLTDVCLVVENQGRYLVRKRPEGELWAGLWDFPRFNIDVRTTSSRVGGHSKSERMNKRKKDSASFRLTPSQLSELEHRLNELTGVRVRVGEQLAEIQHAVTRYQVRLIGLRTRFESGRLKRVSGLKWVRKEELAELALTGPVRKLCKHLW